MCRAADVQLLPMSRRGLPARRTANPSPRDVTSTYGPAGRGHVTTGPHLPWSRSTPFPARVQGRPDDSSCFRAQQCTVAQVPKSAEAQVREVHLICSDRRPADRNQTQTVSNPSPQRPLFAHRTNAVWHIEQHGDADCRPVRSRWVRSPSAAFIHMVWKPTAAVRAVPRRNAMSCRQSKPD